MTEYMIGKRRFRSIGEHTTLRHDLATQGQIERARVSRLQLLPAETPEDYALRIFRTAVTNADVLLLLGHLLLPDDETESDWNPAMAAEVADFLGSLTDDADKAKVRGILTAALMDFLQAGPVYAVRSLRSSAQASEQALPKHQTAA